MLIDKMMACSRFSDSGALPPFCFLRPGPGLCVVLTTRMPGADKHETRTLLHISLACLEIRSRNEEAINSTRNRIYSLKVFYSLLLDIWVLLTHNNASKDCFLVSRNSRQHHHNPWQGQSSLASKLATTTRRQHCSQTSLVYVS